MKILSLWAECQRQQRSTVCQRYHYWETKEVLWREGMTLAAAQEHSLNYRSASAAAPGAGWDSSMAQGPKGWGNKGRDWNKRRDGITIGARPA
jgi:hypothetical protein